MILALLRFLSIIRIIIIQNKIPNLYNFAKFINIVLILIIII